MRRGVVPAALCALALASPATAERFYVPVVGTTAADGSALATRVWVANAAGVETPIVARFHAAARVERDERVVAARAEGQILADLAPAGKAGLIAIEADPDLELSAWTVGRGEKGLATAEVPVFSAREAFEAGLDVPLSALPGRRAMASLLVGAANLSAETAFCSASLSGRNGDLLAEIAFEVAPHSLAREEALTKLGRGRITEVRVTCDQSFYPFAVAVDKSGLEPTFAGGVGPNGACDTTPMLTKDTKGMFIISQAGIFHDATRADPKGIICIRAPGQLKIAKAIFEWDVTVGPWSSRNRSGIHNLGYFFLDRYRSGVVGNINAAGPNKSFLKLWQNLNMPRGTNTNAKVGYELERDKTYHFIYTFDAVNKIARLQTFLNGVEVRTLSKDIKPGNNQTLLVTPYGKEAGGGLAMVAEWGNYVGQHPPEEATLSWKYRDFKLTLVPK